MPNDKWMTALSKVENSPAYRWIAVVGGIGGAFEAISWVLRQMDNVELASIGNAMEGLGLFIILIALILLWHKLRILLQGQQELIKKNLDLVEKAERLEKRLSSADYYLKETQERVTKLLHDTTDYFEFAADIQTYRAEGAMMGKWTFNDTELFNRHIAEAKAKEWYDLDKHFEKRFPEMPPQERWKRMEKVLGYRVDK
jgi:ribosomal silencing factor RsfS